MGITAAGNLNSGKRLMAPDAGDFQTSQEPDQALRMAGPRAKIVPGHGALADREALLKYHNMLVTVRDRVQKLKAAGRTGKEAVAAKPTADLDPAWGTGFVQPDAFVTIVYNTL